MTNVLVGIIGVILFIGLALAGALFLGPRFQESRNTALASTMIQGVTQIASAANLSRVEGTPRLQAGEPVQKLVDTDYLAAIPPNPTDVEGARLLSENGFISGGHAVMAAMRIAPENAPSICATIVRQTANSNETVAEDGVPEATTPFDIPRGPSGCFRAAIGFGNLAQGEHYAFARF